MDVSIKLLKSQQNYFPNYVIGNSRRMLGDKIDMSTPSKRGVNTMYDTFVYDTIQYKTEYIELQSEICSYN